MVRQCQVCKKSTHLNPEVSFHKFPTDIEARKLWFSIVGIKKGQWLPKLPEICSDHFNPSDIHTKANGLRYVNPGATPKSHSILASSSDSGDEPAVTYSEELYKTLLKQHKLNDKSSDLLSCQEKEDAPLTYDPPDVNQQAQNNSSQAIVSNKKRVRQKSTKNKAFVLEIKNEPLAALQMKEGAADAQMECQTEFIKIEIVNDESGNPSDDCQSPTKEAFLIEDATTEDRVSTPTIHKTKTSSVTNKTGRSLRQHRVHESKPQNKKHDQTRKSSEHLDICYSESQRIEPPLSLNDLSSLELDFNYYCNFNNNLNDERVISFTGVESEILDFCEKCMENTLYTEGVSEIKNIRPKVVLVLTKLKTNLPFKVLEMVLGLQPAISTNIFYTALDLFHVSLKSAVCWFTRKELKCGKEKFFTDYYDRVRVILFKLVFRVNKCQKSKCDVHLCQQYNKYDAVQVVVGLSPKRNLFSYVTNAYDSKITTDLVLKKEKLLSHLCSQGDIVCITENHVEYSLLLNDCQKQGIVLRIVRDMKREVQDYADNTLRKLLEYEIIRYREIKSHMVPFIGKAVGVICGVLNLRFEAEHADELLDDVDI